jgi:hypothetical protein
MQRNGYRWPRPTTVIVATAVLCAALGGTVYAAAKIDGRSIKVKSLPGNRIKPHSIPANRLSASASTGSRVTGSQVDERSLAQVPSADFADQSAYATLAREAETSNRAKVAENAEVAQNAVHAVDADTVNGHEAGCRGGYDFFAGACWKTSALDEPLSAPAAAKLCGAEGGSLPEALELAAFSQRKGIELSPSGEWSSEIANISGPNLYAMTIVLPSGQVDFMLFNTLMQFRCVIPLVT